jgi:hypothetical protein
MATEETGPAVMVPIVVVPVLVVQPAATPMMRPRPQ